ncbi:LOW QUALITY PROTEIN: uncharacterized protein MT2089-like [Paramacrobiotus metropolitanus]|uniref:LOW QUALITY PROTEIN: uncharacterized protein MT2089-like n=1 Tax=Paramacrobiotus metropolitanus TaxID=2943436 RepID=UPI002445ACC9|nr:LOW QUALITY PROTEIN: uncharacterized protein MT2089-like [Paramacrobiotus metropolitanus]
MSLKRFCSRIAEASLSTAAAVSPGSKSKNREMAIDIFNKASRDEIARHSVPLHLIPKKRDYDELMEAIGSARVVLIGEASHGTHEFYRERALITKRLIEEKDFTCIAVEGDFPDTFTVNRYVQQLNKQTNAPKSAREALEEYNRFPLWMWRNYVMLNFVEWLRHHNDRVGKSGGDKEKSVLCGLDVYSLHRSADAVIEYLERVDPKAAKAARDQYECFEKFGDDTTMYAFAARYNLTSTCEKEAMNVLKALKEHTEEYLQKTKDGLEMESELFGCLMNAAVVEGAERYYRVMMDADATSWNVRDSCMVAALERLMHWKTEVLGRPAKVVVWAHNSHLGDARFTEMGRRRKEHNIGQLCREKWGDNNVYNIGFSTYNGEVTCASDWGQKRIEKKTVNNAMDGSYEKFFHEVAMEHNIHNFLTIFKKISDDKKPKKAATGAHPFPKLPDNKDFKSVPITSFPLERAIGVIYRPETERYSHFFEAYLSEQFDAVIHIVKLSTLLALDDKARKPGLEEENLPELFPFGL